MQLCWKRVTLNAPHNPMHTMPYFIRISCFLGALFSLSLFVHAKPQTILALEDPANFTEIDHAIYLLTQNHAQGIYFKGEKWPAQTVYLVTRRLQQKMDKLPIVWASPFLLPHGHLPEGFPLPNWQTLQHVRDTLLLQTFFRETQAYAQKLGVQTLVWSVPREPAPEADARLQHVLRSVGGSAIFEPAGTTIGRVESWIGTPWHTILPTNQLPSQASETWIMPLRSPPANFPRNEPPALLNRYEGIADLTESPSSPLPSAALWRVAPFAYEQSIGLYERETQRLPLKNLPEKAFTALHIGYAQGGASSNRLEHYATMQHHFVPLENLAGVLRAHLRALTEAHQHVVVWLNTEAMSEVQCTLVVARLSEWKKGSKASCIVLYPGSTPAYLARLQASADVMLSVPQQNPYTVSLLPQALFGSIALPQAEKARVRLGFALPEQLGFSSAKLARIDEIVREGLEEDAMPGCQVLIAKNGRIVFSKNYGHHSYNRIKQVTPYSLYDLASLTKVLATLPVLMHLEGSGRIGITGQLSDYLPETLGTNKGPMKLQEILTHQAGLMSFIPHWYQLMDKSTFDTSKVAFERNERFPTEVVPGLYAAGDIAEQLWQWTLHSRLTTRSKRGNMHRYFYSDLGFYIFQRLAESLTHRPLDVLADSLFYQRLGLQTLTYLPLRKFEPARIAPTEMDIYFRKSLVHGTVHDPGAAMRGGVGGHAGLFANAFDVGTMMQLFLQKGMYGGETLLPAATVEKFNTQPYLQTNQNRRALGWDKPTPDGVGGSTSNLCSPATFGHTGFTGTCAWADPEHELVYVFLSNRVHPFAGNTALAKMGIRTRIHTAIYEAFLEEE